MRLSRQLCLVASAALAACSSGSDDSGGRQPLDLTERLGAGEVRAGVIVDDVSLFGGISAEGRLGDFKLYNDRVQFIVQGFREGDYYLEQGGGVIDADIVRPDGQLGRDIVEEWGPMLGFGRIMDPQRIEVVNDGADGEPAIIRVLARESALALLEGALEAPGFVPDLGMRIITEYRLAPDSWLLEVYTRVNAPQQEVSIEIGDLLMGAPEVAERWEPVTGFANPSSRAQPFKAYVGHRNEVVAGVFTPPGGSFVPTSVDLVASLVDSLAGFAPRVTIPVGGSAEALRYWGVGPDLATLTDAWLEATDQAGQAVTGQVTAPDGPVAGARVHVLVDDAPWTIALTDADGRFDAQAPAGAVVSTRATGRGPGLFPDHPEGWAPVPAYAAQSVRDASFVGLADGAVAVPLAMGRGEATAAAPLALGEPATVRVTVADGLPTTVRLGFADGDPGGDARWVERRPDGLAAAGWSRDGSVDLVVPPGRYSVLVSRGQRFETHAEVIEAVAGAVTEVSASLPASFNHDGWVLADPHAHASPSGDGGVPMEDRLAVHAGGGVQLHFGTDHDRVVDYRPYVTAMGLDDVMRSVVGCEMSPVLRGHVNIYPLTPDESKANFGAWPWWRVPVTSTQEEFDILRGLFPTAVFQSNHPLDSGVGDSAGWSPGQIARASFWTEDFDALEVLNGGDIWLDYYFDLVNRGIVRTPVGVTDSHTWFQNQPGVLGTWIAAPNGLASMDDAALIDAFAARQTIVSRGVFLSTSIVPGALITAPTEVVVEARASTAAVVERLQLYRDGELIDEIDGDSGTFMLEAERDASFVVIASGTQPMVPLSTRTPWAMTSAWLLDVDGNGWQPPLPPLVVR